MLRISKNFKYSKINKFTFTTIVKNSKILMRNELPTEEETIDILLKEMNKTDSKQIISKQKDDIIFVSGEEQNYRTGQFYMLNDRHLSQCVSIKENLMTFLLLERIRYLYLT
jgi:hypothetical protein